VNRIDATLKNGISVIVDGSVKLLLS